MRNSLVVASLGLALFGCRSSSNNPDSSGGSDAPNGGTVTIQMIQDPMMAAGTQVAVAGVVVTAIDNFGGTVGNFWIEEPEGGPNSGVLVYHGDASTVATLNPGDIISLSGAVKDEFALTGSNADPTGRTDVELEPVAGGTMTITKTGTGSVPAPAVVDALMYGQMSDADAQGPNFSAAWKQWDGVLVTMTNVAALGAPKAFGSTSPTPADDYAFGITGVAKVEGSLSDITMSGVARNTCLSSVTGIVDYFYDYLVLPRTTADLVTGGTGCPAAETVCGDSIDNDGNGFADCEDDNCIITADACHTTTTIKAIDLAGDADPANPTLPAAGVLIASSCVTAINGTNLYLATAGTAAADQGIYMYGGGQPLPTGLAVGDTVDLVGTVSSFKSSGSTAPDGEIELAALQVTKDVGTCTAVPKAVTSPMSTLTMDTSGHPLIGSLVTLTPTGGLFKITTALSAGHHFGVMTQGATTISFGDGLLAAADADFDAVNCFASLTGIWTYDTTGAGSYEILPTVAPTLGVCP